MKLNFVLPTVGTAGGVRVVFEYANRLDARGHDVTILYPTVPPRNDRRWIEPKARASQSLGTVNRLTVGKGIDWFDLNVEVRQIPTLAPTASSLSSRRVPEADATIATSWETAYFVAELDRSVGRKFYFVQHYEIWPLWDDLACWEKAAELSPEDPSLGMVNVSCDDRYKRRYKSLVDRSYELPLDLIITSEWEREVMDELGHEPVGSGDYGVNFDTFYPEEPSDATTILALYRNARHKGDREAIESFVRLHESHPSVEFVMFGTSRSDEVPNFVTFHEDPSQREIRSIYSDADIMVYPSWVEGYGMPPMEAMACRTAIISTGVGAVRDYSPEGAIEFIPRQDASAIVDSVNYLFEQQDIEHMKQAGYHHIQQFTWEQAALGFKKVVNQTTDWKQ